MNALKKSNIELDRKALADMAAEDEKGIWDLVALVKENAA